MNGNSLLLIAVAIAAIYLVYTVNNLRNELVEQVQVNSQLKKAIKNSEIKYKSAIKKVVQHLKRKEKAIKQRDLIIERNKKASKAFKDELYRLSINKKAVSDWSSDPVPSDIDQLFKQHANH